MVQQILHNRRKADKPYSAFADSWRDLAERFLSCLWHDPAAGREAAIKAGLRPESFPEPWLLVLAKLLVACRIKEYEPDTGFIRRALRDLGEHVEEPDLERIRWRHCCAVSVERYALLLADFGRRRVLHDRLGLLQECTLDTFEPVGNITERVLQDIHDFQRDGTRVPNPPRLTRQPVIVTRPRRVAACLRGPARLKRRRSPSR